MDPDQPRTIPVFADLSDQERATIAERMREVKVGLGDVLAREGDYAYNLFVVTEGLGAVASGQRLLTTLHPGDWFGELGLLTAKERTANVVALSPMTLLAMVLWDFNDVLREMPGLAATIRQRAVEHLERS